VAKLCFKHSSLSSNCNHSSACVLYMSAEAYYDHTMWVPSRETPKSITPELLWACGDSSRKMSVSWWFASRLLSYDMSTQVTAQHMAQCATMMGQLVTEGNLDLWHDWKAWCETSDHDFTLINSVTWKPVISSSVKVGIYLGPCGKDLR
jgi:hypothetical protein